MPLHADLYLDRIDLGRHAGSETCQLCKVESLEELLDRLRSGQLAAGTCPHWPRERVAAFRMALDAGEALPVIPSLEVPRAAEAGVLDLSGPSDESPVLVTGNSQLTQAVLLAVLSTMTEPLWMVGVDTLGHTVDMALVFETLTPEAIAGALKAGTSDGAEFAGRIILPGLAADLAGPVGGLIGRSVDVGPVCAAELPLFFAAQRAPQPLPKANPTGASGR